MQLQAAVDKQGESFLDLLSRQIRTFIMYLSHCNEGSYVYAWLINTLG